MKKVGLLLSGGIAKGAYQIGALEAVSEYLSHRDFCCVSASSIGVLNTYAFITGELDHARELWDSINAHGEKTYMPSMLKSDFLQTCIKSIVKADALTVPFYMPLWNIRNGSVMYAELSRLEPEKLYTYMRAGVAMPIYNKGVEIEGNTYYDGGLIDNIPIYPISAYDMDYIICMYFDNCNYIFENPEFDQKVIKINFPSDRSILDSFRFRHDLVERMISDGRQCAQKVLDTVFAGGLDDVEAIKRRIKVLNASNALTQKPRVTGDIVINNLDKLMLRYAKRRIVHDGGSLAAAETSDGPIGIANGGAATPMSERRGCMSVMFGKDGSAKK